jgi:hypothetical protein
MRNHSAMLAFSGNPVATVDIEVYDTLSDLASGFNVAGLTAPAQSNSGPGVTNSNGSASTPAKTTVAFTVANSGLELEVKLGRYFRMVATAYTSGSVQAKLQA